MVNGMYVRLDEVGLDLLLYLHNNKVCFYMGSFRICLPFEQLRLNLWVFYLFDSSPEGNG